MSRPAPLLQRRVVVVVGKGGVGKSVVSGTLGLLAASRGRKAVIAELGGAETMAALLDRPEVGYGGGELAPGLDGVSIQPAAAIEEYLVRMLRFRVVYELVFRNRHIEPFMNGVMGLSDLISVGKVMDLEWTRADGSTGPEGVGPHRWDLVVVDAPATGHGLSLLRAPQAMMDLTRVGPLHANARLIHELIADPARTAVLLVTLPEEMPITETLELADGLRRQTDVPIAGVVVNAMPPEPVSPTDPGWCALRARELPAPASDAVRSVERALTQRRRAEAQVARLDALGLPVLRLPLLADRDLDAAALAVLGQHLEAWA